MFQSIYNKSSIQIKVNAHVERIPIMVTPPAETVQEITIRIRLALKIVQDVLLLSLRHLLEVRLQWIVSTLRVYHHIS